MKTELYFSLLLAFMLMGSQTGAISENLTKYMKDSGLKKYCKESSLDEEGCVKFLKKLCGIQRVSDPTEDDELKACLDRERCGQELVSVKVKRSTRQEIPTMKWKKNRLTYFVYNMPTRTTLKKSEIEKMTKLALGVWGCYAQLYFSPARSLKDADFVVMFGSKKHDWFNHITKAIMNTPDGMPPFDDESGVLGHGFFPFGNEKNGNMHMDDAENWSADLKGSSINTFNVLVHELGHALGIRHIISDSLNVMAPFYNAIREATVDLGPDDKLKIQSLYGSKTCTNKEWQVEFNKWFPPKPKRTGDHPKCAEYDDIRYCQQSWHRENCRKQCGLGRVLRESGKSANPHVCKQGALHGIFDFVDGYTYIIADGYLYRRSNEEGRVDMSFRQKVSSMWRTAPAKPTAAVYSRAAKSLFLFEGKDVFIISGLHGKINAKNVRVRRVTVKDPKYPVSPSAAFIKFDDRNSGNVYLVKGHETFVFNTKKRTVMKSFQFRKLFKVGRYGKRIPRAVDGAYHSFEDDTLFFFTGSSYTLGIPDEKTSKYVIPSGTRPFSTNFLHCPQE